MLAALSRDLMLFVRKKLPVLILWWTACENHKLAGKGDATANGNHRTEFLAKLKFFSNRPFTGGCRGTWQVLVVKGHDHKKLTKELCAQEIRMKIVTWTTFMRIKRHPTDWYSNDFSIIALSLGSLESTLKVSSNPLVFVRLGWPENANRSLKKYVLRQSLILGPTNQL